MFRSKFVRRSMASKNIDVLAQPSVMTNIEEGSKSSMALNVDIVDENTINKEDSLYTLSKPV